MDQLKAFLDATENRPPRDTLVAALALGPPPGRALDLGCGAGCDTVGLLRHGYTVTAVDVHPDAVARTRATVSRAGDELDDRLDTRVASYASLDVGPGEIALINASFSLPFSEPSEFGSTWNRFATWLAPGGFFVGQLFGDRDEWNGREGAPSTFQTRAEVDRLVAPYRVRMLDEVERDGVTAIGTPKHWHVFHLILEKR